MQPLILGLNFWLDRLYFRRAELSDCDVDSNGDVHRGQLPQPNFRNKTCGVSPPPTKKRQILGNHNNLSI